MNFYANINRLPSVENVGTYSPQSEWSHFTRTFDDGTYTIYYMISGQMYIEENGIKYVLNAGDMLVLEPFLMHRGYKKANCKYFYAHFKNIDFTVGDDELPAKTDKGDCIMLPKYYRFGDMSAHTQIESIINTMISRRVFLKNSTDIFLCGKLLELFAEITAAVINKSVRFTAESISETIKYFIELRYMEKITGELLEKSLNMNFDYMNRIFKKQNGITVFDYLKFIRIERAKFLLEHTDMKCYEIAFNVGFQNEYYFNKVFSKKTGFSPNKYRHKVADL